MLELLVLTGNKHKLQEIKNIAKGNLNKDSLLLSIKDRLPDFDINIIEDGKTYLENAKKKIEAYLPYIKEDFLIADDSGLEIEFFDNKPGIHSARFLSPLDYSQRNEYILNKMKDIPVSKRKAKFVCVAALYNPVIDKVLTFKGILEGIIGFSQKGTHGFGYDPIFYLPDMHKYLAELPLHKKNLISHRAKAFKKLFAYINKLYDR